ncbi:MAG TPA: hypothetical protein VMG82_29900 [Candidatus Sulfotelmatobacter sp.]|nr:hypothetical protein [Candidatus Sulfotelmatobacter sp.]
MVCSTGILRDRRHVCGHSDARFGHDELRGAYAIFYTPVDQNTWCNQRHNVPYVFPETQQADNYTPLRRFSRTS